MGKLSMMTRRSVVIRRSSPLALFAAILLGSCTSTVDLQVRAEYSRTASFNEWKTFRFASGPSRSGRGHYPMYEQIIRSAIEEELTARDYTRIEEGAPDFRVAFELVFRGDSKPQVTPQTSGAEPQAKSYAGGRPSGTLIVKMLDPLSGQVLWTGQISNIQMNAITTEKKLRNAVWRVLAEFPPLTK